MSRVFGGTAGNRKLAGLGFVFLAVVIGGGWGIFKFNIVALKGKDKKKRARSRAGVSRRQPHGR